MEKTSLNIDENIESLLCYVGLWITGLIFLFAEKENKTVKFHAKQSLFLFLPMNILGIIFWWIGTPKVTYSRVLAYGNVYVNMPTYDAGIAPLLWLSWIIWIVMVVLFIILIVTAYQGQKFKIPIVGDLAEK